LKSLPFRIRVEQEADVSLSIPGVTWWKIDQRKIGSAYCATEGYTTIATLKPEGGGRQVFAWTDGGRSRFSVGLWNLFAKHQ
jgi:hypothetical protein